MGFHKLTDLSGLEQVTLHAAVSASLKLWKPIFDLRLADLKPGDWICGFEHWSCVGTFAKRQVECSSDGQLFVSCKQGRHYLDGQLADDGQTLLGMFRYSPDRLRVFKKWVHTARAGAGTGVIDETTRLS